MVSDAESRWNKICMTEIANEWNFQNFSVCGRMFLLFQLEYLPFLKPPRRVLGSLRTAWEKESVWQCMCKESQPLTLIQIVNLNKVSK